MQRFDQPKLKGKTNIMYYSISEESHRMERGNGMFAVFLLSTFPCSFCPLFCLLSSFACNRRPLPSEGSERASTLRACVRASVCVSICVGERINCICVCSQPPAHSPRIAAHAVQTKARTRRRRTRWRFSHFERARLSRRAVPSTNAKMGDNFSRCDSMRNHF